MERCFISSDDFLLHTKQSNSSMMKIRRKMMCPILIEIISLISIKENFPIEINIEDVQILFPNLINEDEQVMQFNLANIEAYPLSSSVLRLNIMKSFYWKVNSMPELWSKKTVLRVSSLEKLKFDLEDNLENKRIRSNWVFERFFYGQDL
jgi:hypothetical protein